MKIETKRSFCRICHAACPVDVEFIEGKVTKILGVEDDPLFEGYTCVKGRQLPEQIHSPSRIRYPLKKMPDGHFEEISSNEIKIDKKNNLSFFRIFVKVRTNDYLWNSCTKFLEKFLHTKFTLVCFSSMIRLCIYA